MNTHNNTTTTEYATRFFILDEHDRLTYMPLAYCDRYATLEEAYRFGRDSRGLFDGFVIETVTSS